jgi:type IX secretion system PorP/SprF family membrane protein
MCFGIYQAKAQDVQYSQFYAVPLYQNPAFAGSVHALRGIADTRLQWLGLDANYKTYYFSADTYLDKYNSGLGIQFIRDIQGNNTISSNELSFMYSYELPVSKSFTVRAGLQGSAVQKTLDYSNLTFPGQYNDQQGFIGGGNYNLGAQNKWYPDVSSGVVAYSDRFWGGFSLHHMNMPNQSFPGGGNAALPIKYAVTAGYRIPLAQRNYLAYSEDKTSISITPTIHYKSQGKSDQFDIGLYAVYNQLMAGMWYRGIPVKNYERNQNNESMVFLVGWLYKNWAFGYSYDLTLSKLVGTRQGGSHEINVTYIHRPTKKHKPMRKLPCPSFYKH